MAAAVLPVAYACVNPDTHACASAFVSNTAEAASFCATVTAGSAVAATDAPALFSSACDGATKSYSSMCSCFVTGGSDAATTAVAASPTTVATTTAVAITTRISSAAASPVASSPAAAATTSVSDTSGSSGSSGSGGTAISSLAGGAGVGGTTCTVTDIADVSILFSSLLLDSILLLHFEPPCV